MVIFYSYVKLPEGTPIFRPTQLTFGPSSCGCGQTMSDMFEKRAPFLHWVSRRHTSGAKNSGPLEQGNASRNAADMRNAQPFSNRSETLAVDILVQ